MIIFTCQYTNMYSKHTISHLFHNNLTILYYHVMLYTTIQSHFISYIRVFITLLTRHKLRPDTQIHHPGLPGNDDVVHVHNTTSGCPATMVFTIGLFYYPGFPENDDSICTTYQPRLPENDGFQSIFWPYSMPTISDSIRIANRVIEIPIHYIVQFTFQYS